MTVLYVNGDGHSSAAYANSDFGWASEDYRYSYRALQPHPDNLLVSYGSILGGIVKARVFCEAEIRCSNWRIARTTRDWLKNPQMEEVIVIIGWTSWDREEWEYEGGRYQVGLTGDDPMPLSLKEKYREWVLSGASRRQENQDKNHDLIWDLHQELNTSGVKHLFFNSCSAFDLIEDQRDWQGCYIDPYEVDQTYLNVLESKGCQRAGDTGFYRENGHFVWAQYLLPYLVRLL
jgi:hypothetical protein